MGRKDLDNDYEWREKTEEEESDRDKQIDRQLKRKEISKCEKNG